MPIQCDGVGPWLGLGLDPGVYSIGGIFGLHGPDFGRSSDERKEVLAGLGVQV